MAFARGFKARCETIARSIRRELGHRPHAPLSVSELAEYVGVELMTPRDIPGMSDESLRVMIEDEKEDWSALTTLIAGVTVVIYNPMNSPGRHSSDITHELAHVELRHTPSTLMFAPDGTWTLRTYDDQQEAEAAWLSGCLLLPRPALLHIAEMDLSEGAAAERYMVSRQLLGYRKVVTGVPRQMERRRAARCG